MFPINPFCTTRARVAGGCCAAASGDRRLAPKRWVSKEPGGPVGEGINIDVTPIVV